MDLRPGLARDLDATFPAFVRAHQDWVYSLAARTTGRAGDAEEIAQVAFIRAYRSFQRWPAARIEGLQVRPWLAQITRNLCRDTARSRARRPTTPLDAAAAQVAAVEAAPLGEDGAAAWAALLLGIPERARTAVVLRHVEGWPYRDIAAALGVPEGTVKSDVHRAVAQLRAGSEEAGMGGPWTS